MQNIAPKDEEHAKVEEEKAGMNGEKEEKEKGRMEKQG